MPNKKKKFNARFPPVSWIFLQFVVLNRHAYILSKTHPYNCTCSWLATYIMWSSFTKLYWFKFHIIVSTMCTKKKTPLIYIVCQADSITYVIIHQVARRLERENALFVKLPWNSDCKLLILTTILIGLGVRTLFVWLRAHHLYKFHSWANTVGPPPYPSSCRVGRHH